MNIRFNIYSLLVICLVLIITLSPGELRNIFVSKVQALVGHLTGDQGSTLLKQNQIEVTGHFLTFLTVGLLTQSWLSSKQFIQGALLITNIAALSEFGQSLVPARETSLEDFAINVFAGFIGITLYIVFNKPKPTL